MGLLNCLHYGLRIYEVLFLEKPTEAVLEILILILQCKIAWLSYTIHTILRYFYLFKLLSNTTLTLMLTLDPYAMYC